METAKKEELMYQHSLEIKRIIIEKFALGIVVICIGFLGNLYIEHFKVSNAIKMYHLEETISAVKEIRTEYFATIKILYDICHFKEKRTEKNDILLANQIKKYAAIVGSHRIYLSQDYHELCQKIITLQYGAALNYESLAPDYAKFFSDIGKEYIFFTRKEVDKNVEGIERGFGLNHMSLSEINEMGPAAYMKKMFLRWKKEIKLKNNQ